MSVELPTITPRSKQAGGCCTAPVEPDVSASQASDVAAVAKALGDPVRLRIVDVVRKASPEALCQCELTPLFDISQPAISKHLRVLRDAGVLGMEKRGLWSYYFVPEDSTLEVLDTWLS
jgi:ArsR family transcriptional regulator, arsenate/arsenite/antimonite-responsive transcriptional repressor